MRCPHCGHEQSSTTECEKCGIIFDKISDAPEHTALEALFGDANMLRLNESPRGALSMLTGWPVAREFDIVDAIGRQRGSVAQSRMWGSIEFAVFTYPDQRRVMTLRRPYFFLFSEITVDGLGSAKRKFSLLQKRYDLRDPSGRTFATVVSPVMHPWTFQIFDGSGQQHAEISKQWAGMTAEMMTGAQRFQIDFIDHDWPLPQRAVILAAALSIDFDAFEKRRRR